jgi:Mn2+/Fe2+ NRAMP family transporter
VFGAFALLSVFGMVGLAVTVMLGFEEPNNTLFLSSSVLMFAAPVAMLTHLIFTRELTLGEKRIWIRQLAGRHAARAFSAYLASHDRSATADRLAAEALAGFRDSRTKDP